MESPRKFNDCYFYYYSTCTKGDNCVFRHEPSALGCETMCVQWQQGKCLDKHCKLRHMELRKNRKQIPCYWESQPGGCRKKHCPFQHKNPEARTDGILPAQPIPQPSKTVAAAGNVGADAEPALAAAPAPAPAPLPPPHAALPPHPANAASMVMPHHEMMWQQQRGPVVLDSAILGVLPSADMLGRRVPQQPHDAASLPQYAAMPVDPLVVNFEEESDNESAPSSTPTKMVSPEDGPVGVRGKSQELLLLEQIQAASAAYYSYESVPAPAPPARYERCSLDELTGHPRARTNLDFKILSLDEIRARKRASDPAQLQIDETKSGRKRKLSSHDTILAPNKVIKVVRNNSVVYKKFNGNTAQVTDSKNVPEDADGSRMRTFSVESDLLSINDDELDDSLKAMITNLPPSNIKQIDVHDKPKEIKIKLIRSHSESEKNSCELQFNDECLDASESASDMCVIDDDENKSVVDLDIENTAEDLLEETIVLSDEDSKLDADDIEEVAVIIDPPIREAVTNKNKCNNEDNLIKSKHYKEGVEEIVIDAEDSSSDSITPEIEQSLKTVIVPDVVASCHSDKFDTTLVHNDDEKVLNEIDIILKEGSL